MTTLEQISFETMKFMRGRYKLDEIGDGKDELKFKQGQKSILTIYIREDRYTFLIIFGKKEREKFDAVRTEFSQYILNYYDNSKTFHDGKWMFISDLLAYCNQLETDVISFEDIYLDPMQFVEGFEDGKFGVFDRSNRNYRERNNTVRKGGDRAVQRPANYKQKVLLVEGAAVENYIRQNPNISIQSKIDMLNERLIIKINDEFLGKGVKYTEAEKKAILKAYRGRYGAKEWKYSIFNMYRDFLEKQIIRGYDVEKPTLKFDVYDLAALAYLYKRVKETEAISEAHHVVIDEAQDYGMMAYSVLKFCIKDCTYTIMGDVSQNIHFGYGLNDWEELKNLYMTTDRASFDILKKSYRNTIEISNFATAILHHGQFSVYPVEPIIRHGNPVEVIDTTKSGDAAVENLSGNPFVQKAAEICKAWQKKGVETIAVICRDHEEASKTAMELSQITQIIESDLEKAEFSKGIMVLPVEYTKGLEFDAVLIWNPTREAYPTDDGHAKLLYVAATRALHELCVLHDGNLTGLIADPIPERETKMYSDNLLEASDRARKLSGRDSCMSDGTFIQDALKSGGEKITKPKAVAAVKKANVSDMPGETKRIPVIAARPSAVKNTTGTSFGDIPVTEILSPPGHSQIDLAVRFLDKQSDGIYLHSRYGVLRISPVHSNAIRITFAKGNSVSEGTHRKIALKKLNRFCRFKDSSKMFEIVNDEICLQVDKSTGAIRYMNRDKKLLLEERGNACRQLEVSSKGAANYRLYLKWQKDEQIYGHRIANKLSENLRGKARYISHSAQSEDLPLLISDKGYGILLASEGPAF